jgi:hypothetical protein
MKPTVPDVVPLVRAYYGKPGNEAGGSLHIVLDDCNVDDADVRFCRDTAAERDDDDGVALADILLTMSKTQRLKLARLKLEEIVPPQPDTPSTSVLPQTDRRDPENALDEARETYL